jgi:2-C-methyl-D-erythritol 4-phosphate cytidylyltransferase
MSLNASGTPKFAFLITAAGSGNRMGKGLKKEFRIIDDSPVLALTLKNFLDTSIFSYGVITCIPGTHNKVKALLTSLEPQLKALNSPLLFCDGGAERQDSVHSGLKCLAENYPDLKEQGFVLIHDGARPWADISLIKAVADGTVRHRACAPITASIDAMKEINDKGIITGHLPRKETVSVQTPQGFAFNEIFNAHNRAAEDGRHYIDDTEIFSRYEGDVYTVAGTAENRKITFVTDLVTPPKSKAEE